MDLKNLAFMNIFPAFSKRFSNRDCTQQRGDKFFLNRIFETDLTVQYGQINF
jgi:hypothetical protein